MPRRCELGCPYTFGVTHHQFPHPEKNLDRFKAWVLLVGGKLESPQDYENYKKRVICDRHFKAEDKNRNNRLNFMALPSLYLPGVDAMEAVEVTNNISNVPEALPATSDTPVISTQQISVWSPINQPHVTATYDFKTVAAEHNYFRTPQKTVSNMKNRSYLRITSQEFTTLPLDIVVQAVLSLFAVMWGVLNVAGNLREIQAAAELNNVRWETQRNILSFYTFNHRGKALTLNYVPSASKCDLDNVE